MGPVEYQASPTVGHHRSITVLHTRENAGDTCSIAHSARLEHSTFMSEARRGAWLRQEFSTILDSMESCWLPIEFKWYKIQVCDDPKNLKFKINILTTSIFNGYIQRKTRAKSARITNL